jgi:hypothetical protein
MDKVQKPSMSECYTPLSESFGSYISSSFPFLPVYTAFSTILVLMFSESASSYADSVYFGSSYVHFISGLSITSAGSSVFLFMTGNNVYTAGNGDTSSLIITFTVMGTSPETESSSRSTSEYKL